MPTKTSLEVTTEALRTIKVCPVHRAPKAEDHVRAKAKLESLLEQLSTTYGIAQEWTIETIPDGAFEGLADWLAGSICLAYNRPEYRGLLTTGRSSVLAHEYAQVSMTQYPAQVEYF